MLRLTGAAAESDLLGQVIKKSGQNLLKCLQCGKCSGSCPIASGEVGGPRRLIALILSGAEDRALKDETWWYCVSCGTCASRCPVEINMYRVATALCEIAECRGIDPSEPDIHLFEKLFVKSLRKSGRVRELNTVLQYNLFTLNPFKDAVVGLKLMLKGAVTPADILNPGRRKPRVDRIFAHVERIREGE